MWEKIVCEEGKGGLEGRGGEERVRGNVRKANWQTIFNRICDFKKYMIISGLRVGLLIAE